MKKIDFKSLLIGVLLGTTCLSLFGSKSQDKNMGDIVVKSIKLVNDKGETVISMYTESDKAGRDSGHIIMYDTKNKKATVDIESGNELAKMSLNGSYIENISLRADDWLGGTISVKDEKGNEVKKIQRAR